MIDKLKKAYLRGCQDLDDQLKINAMGAEREYILLGKIERLEKEIALLQAQLKQRSSND